MPYNYLSYPIKTMGRVKTLGAMLLFLCLLLAGQSRAQTVIFSEDFESAPAGTTLLPSIGWDFYTATAGNTRWAVGDGSCAISGNKSLYVARSTAANPCDYAPASSTNRVAYKSFSATDFNNLKLSFKWICNGEKSGTTFYDYGKVCYSLNGTTWTNLPANYQGQTTTQNVIDLALPAALDNQPVVYIGFRWINDDLVKNIPGFVVDDIVITGEAMTPATPAPVLTALSAPSGCAGSTLTITGTDLSGATSVTIGGTAATIVSNTATSITVTVGSGTGGNVVVTTAGGASNGLPFTINPTPAGTATPATASICDGAATSIALSASIPGTSYTWTAAQLSGGTVTGFSDCTSGCAGTIAQTLHATGVTAGVVRYTITPELNSCTGTPLSADVTVYPNPPATATPASSTICSGTSTNIALSTGITGATFSWPAPVITGGTVTGAAAGTGNTINQTLTNTGSTPVTVTYTINATNPAGTGGSCTVAPVTATVVVNPGVQITSQPAGNTQCSGDYTFSVTASNATGYQWYGPSGAIPGATSSTYTLTGASAANSGDYYVVVSGPAGCPDATSNLATLTVSDPAVISLQPTDMVVCEGSPLTLSVTGTGALSYQWYQGGIPLTGATAATYTVASATPGDAGNYYVALNAASPCPSLNSNTVAVTVNPTGYWYGINNNWNDAVNWCGGVPTATTNVLLPTTGTVPFDAHILYGIVGAANSITLQNSTLTVENGGTLQLFGNLNLNPGGSLIADAGTLRLSGTVAQQLQPGFTVKTLMIEGGSDKHLNNDATVRNYLVLGNGKLVLNGRVLRLAPGADIFGVTPTSYIVTNGAGSGLQQVVDAAEYIYPIGLSSYNPVYLMNAGTPDSVKIRVREEVLENGDSGAPINPAISTVILRTWDISESVAGSGNYTVTLQWNGGEENSPAFSYEHAYMAQYTSAGWVNTCCSDADSAGVAIGTDPYTRTKTGITELTHFTVASAAGEAPLLAGTQPGAAFGLQAFPNPVNDVLTVLIKNPGGQGRVSLTDMTGRELAGYSAANGKVTFNMRALAQGMYFVKYTDDQHMQTIKVSKR